jgi:spermidine synthase
MLTMIARKPRLLLLTALLACCSIVYELLLAQSLAAVMGNTVLRYNLTIATYIAALGFGFICYRKFKVQSLAVRLVKVELWLACIGALSPFFVLLIDKFSHVLASATGFDFYGLVIQSFIYIMCYGLIVLVGFLSGFELPLLMDIGEESESSSIKVLAADYGGSVLGVVLFPVLLLPMLGVFGIGLLTGLLNAIAALLVLRFYVKHGECSPKLKYLAAIMVIVLVVACINHQALHNYMVTEVYLAGVAQ